MTDNISNFPEADQTGNIIRPFQLESSSLRGRMVRLDRVLDSILKAHDYPEIVSMALAETITLCALLSSMLKYEGVFTLQTQGDGPVGMLVADMTSDGDIRGCASFDKERVLKMQTDMLESGAPLPLLLGKGHIAFTVDQGADTDRYQGIVELKGNSMVQCVQHYFTQSEQINTGIKLTVGKNGDEWRSAAIMLQEMPEEGGDSTQEKDVKAPLVSNRDEDDWRRSMMFLESCKDEELLASDLHGHDILIRLFHEEGVRVFDPQKLQHVCRCSLDKVKNIVRMMSEEEREEMRNEKEDISMTCEFCSKTYILDSDLLNS
ncbi:MAG: Hsp33 family molecular chaperone HslO [Pseudomonadota bacterium]